MIIPHRPSPLRTLFSSYAGYTGGKNPDPTYESVCSGHSGHAEAIQVYYDPKETSYDALLDVFFGRVDPTTLNRQGNDVGTQYRSAIWYHTAEQKALAEQKIRAVQDWLGKKVVTTVEPAQDYFLAEDYHQKYLERGGRNGNAQSGKKGCMDPIRCYG